MELKDKIKALRKSKGLTQEAFGEKIGVNKACVSRWESGKREPNEVNLREIAFLANQSVFDFCDKEKTKEERECLSCHYKTEKKDFSFCPNCGSQFYEIDLDESERALLDYFHVDQLLKHEEEKALYPYVDLNRRRNKKTNYYSTNKEEDNAIRFASVSGDIKRLEDIKSKVPIVLKELNSMELKVITLLYKSYDKLRKSYTQVNKKTGMDYVFIKNTDIKVKRLVGNYLGYKVVGS